MFELKTDDIRATFSALGARLVSLHFAGADLVQGAGDDSGFLAGDIYAGSVCGRMAGRISKAQFPLDGEIIKLTPTDGSNQLHGGPINFSNSVWQAKQSARAIEFFFTSPDGDQGYPGELTVRATYGLKGSTLSLDFEAHTSKATVVNLTNHTYWNLAGEGSGLDMEVEIDGDHYLPLDYAKLPLGTIAPVEGTRFDFRKLRRVGEPYDNCFVLRGARGEMKRALVMRDPGSGRQMEVFTTEAGLQFYTADHWSEAMPGKGRPLQQYGSIAIEPQNFPDAPNHAGFPSAVLKPGEIYRQRSEWRFS